MRCSVWTFAALALIATVLGAVLSRAEALRFDMPPVIITD
jgi:hypothetical protein